MGTMRGDSIHPQTAVHGCADASQVAFAFERAPVMLSAVDLEMVFRCAATTTA